MPLPPSLCGAVQETDAAPSRACALTFCGAPGTVLGVTRMLAGVPAPLALFATTVMVYCVPFKRPVMVVLYVTGVPVLVGAGGVAHAGEHVTVQLVMELPPVLVGACHVTVACPFPPVAVRLIGALGAVLMVSDALPLVPPTKLLPEGAAVYVAVIR